MPLVFKITAGEEWRAAQAAGVYAGAEIDRADGYIHFSAADQVAATAAKWFKGREDLVLVAVEAEKLGAALRWERSRGDQLFPHLYGRLPLTAVAWSRPLPLKADGAHDFGSWLA
jgi:uncharacterized protein (DUF952 family)